MRHCDSWAEKNRESGREKHRELGLVRFSGSGCEDVRIGDGAAKENTKQFVHGESLIRKKNQWMRQMRIQIRWRQDEI